MRILNDQEIASILKSERWLPSSLSPLAAIQTDQATTNGTITAPLRKAVEWVARPAAVVGLRLSPPMGKGMLWFYLGRERSRSCDLAAHLMRERDQHFFNWTPQVQLPNLWAECLDLPCPEQQGLSFELSRRAFQALVGAIDRNREMVLESLLQRAPDPERRLLASEISDTLTRNVRSGDSRWLSPVCADLSPFSWEVSDLEWGLKELEDTGLLAAKDGGFTLTRESIILCSQLAAPTMWAAVHAKVLVDADRWETRHLAGIGTLGATWLIEFRKLDQPEPSILFRQPSPGEAFELVRSFLNGVNEDALLLRETESLPQVQNCKECDAQLVENARFCSRCGTSTAATAPVSEKAPKKKKPEKKSAPKPKKTAPPPSGEKVKEPPKPRETAPEPPEPPRVESTEPRCPNPKCGKPPVPGKKFCTFCGTKVE